MQPTFIDEIFRTSEHSRTRPERNPTPTRVLFHRDCSSRKTVCQCREATNAQQTLAGCALIHCHSPLCYSRLGHVYRYFSLGHIHKVSQGLTGKLCQRTDTMKQERYNRNEVQRETLCYLTLPSMFSSLYIDNLKKEEKKA